MERYANTLLLVGAALLAVTLSPAQKAQPQTRLSLTQPLRTVAIDASARTDRRPKWERGYFVRYNFPTAEINVTDRSGKLLMQRRMWPENAQQVHISDISISPSGNLAVSFSAVSAGAPASFIAWLDESGKTAKLVEISPAAAMRVCFLDDGTLRALVRVHDERSEEVPEYDLLRHYDGNGLLIGTALPRKLFSVRRYPGYLASLSVSHDRIGLYLPGTRTWADLSL